MGKSAFVGSCVVGKVPHFVLLSGRKGVVSISVDHPSSPGAVTGLSRLLG